MRASVASAILLLSFTLNAIAQSSTEFTLSAPPAGAESPSGVRAGFWWADYDRDGLEDAFVVGADGAARLLHNQGDGSFLDVTLVTGLDGLGAANFAAWQDYDRDGAPDVFVGTQSGPGHLMRNAGDGTFQDVTQFVGLEHSGRHLAAEWFDYDLDGLVDFAVRTDAGEHLYHALSNGHFESVDLGRVAQLAEIAAAASTIDEADASAGDPARSETADPRKPAARRRPRAAGALPPAPGTGITPVGPSWMNAGGPPLNISTCTDVIKNQATAACISASSTPTMGWLYPLTINLNVSGAGNVGIGTITPTAKLEVVGTAKMSDTLTLNPVGDQALNISSGSIYKGGLLFAHTRGGVANTAIGNEALKNVTSGGLNTASGSHALFSNTAGNGNTASGAFALKSNTTGSFNAASGSQALYFNTTGRFNTASGYAALFSNTTGSNNTASGYRTLYSNTTGQRNTAGGDQALSYNTTGSSNTASGYAALFSNTTGSNNTASGYRTLYSNTTGNFNTASGDEALFSNTTGSDNTACGSLALRLNTTGFSNTASGKRALYSNTTGRRNTASGDQALSSNTTGYQNTASGAQALRSNTTGIFNTASGAYALQANTTGGFNTASGAGALQSNTTGVFNTASGNATLFYNTTGSGNTAGGDLALSHNTTGSSNTASGYLALRFNTTGSQNTASGSLVLNNNTTGNYNTALGGSALLQNTTGSRNIALGSNAGSNLTTGHDNIAIGSYGVAGEGGTIRIGTVATQTRTFIAGIRGVATGNANAIPVLIDSNGQLGTVSSSRRFKKNIRDMGDATSRLLELRPVLFDYKEKQTLPDGSAVPSEYGLIAEEVAEIFPDLVVYDDAGKPFTVKYHILSSMLLNEMKKQAREMAEQRSEFEARLAALEARPSPTTASTVATAGERH